MQKIALVTGARQGIGLGIAEALELDGYTVVEIILHTGKTHQIRAHLAHIGNPVLGDNKYGDETANAKNKAKRQRLVAKNLSLESDGILQYLNGKIFVSTFSVENDG